MGALVHLNPPPKLHLSLSQAASHCVLALETLRVLPYLPLPSHWLLASLLINQKSAGDKDLHGLDTQIPS